MRWPIPFTVAVALLAAADALGQVQPRAPQPPQEAPRSGTQRAPAPLPSAKPPAAQPQEPPKIFGLPRVGEGGATQEDVELLQRAARKFLDEGRCSSIDYGDRSMSRPGWYIVSCDGRNIAFKRDDIEK